MLWLFGLLEGMLCMYGALTVPFGFVSRKHRGNKRRSLVPSAAALALALAAAAMKCNRHTILSVVDMPAFLPIFELWLSCIDDQHNCQ